MRANSGSVRNDGVAQARPAVAGETDGKAITKVALASAIGNTIEYYDFTLYATATALVFNKIFFPSLDPLVGSAGGFRHVLRRLLRAPAGRHPVRAFRRSRRAQDGAADHDPDHGHRHGAHRPDAVLRADRHPGADRSCRAANPARHRHRRRVRRRHGDDGRACAAREARGFYSSLFMSASRRDS